MPKLPSIPSGEALNLQSKQRKTGLLSPLGSSSEEDLEETTMDENHDTDDMRCAGWHRQSSPCSVLSVASSGHLYAEPGQTLIFLDWDDTLFPCHEIFNKRQYSKRTREWMLCLGLRFRMLSDASICEAFAPRAGRGVAALARGGAGVPTSCLRSERPLRDFDQRQTALG